MILSTRDSAGWRVGVSDCTACSFAGCLVEVEEEAKEVERRTLQRDRARSGLAPAANRPFSLLVLPLFRSFLQRAFSLGITAES